MHSKPTLTLAFLTHAPESAAEVLELLDPTQAAAFLEEVPVRLSAPVVGRMSAWAGARILATLTAPRAAAILQHTAFHDSAGLLRLIPSERHAAILDELPSRLARRLRNALRYPVGSVGAWIDPDVPGFDTDATVRDTVRYLRDSDGISHLFLQRKSDGQFAGALPIGTMLRSDPGTRLAELPAVRITPLSSRASLASVANNVAWDTFLVLPVIGRSKVIVGGLTRTSLRRGLEERRTAQRMAPGTIPGELLGALGLTLQGLLRLFAGSTKPGTVTGAGESRHG